MKVKEIMIREDKEIIIKEIMALRTMIGKLAVYSVDGFENQDNVDEAQRQLNIIQDKVFNI